MMKTKLQSIKSQKEEAYSKILITEASYVQKQNKVISIGKVIRRICLLDHPYVKTGDVPHVKLFFFKK